MKNANGVKQYVLLDRDGTIIVNKHYQKDPAITELLPHAREGLEALRAGGFGLILVTNQSGIGRGLLTRADMEAVNRSMAAKLGDSEGGYFDGIYFCPHVDADGCRCRKPGTGMIEAAVRDFGFDPRRAYVVGDSGRDIAMGRKAGAATVLVRTGDGLEAERKGGTVPEYVAGDLLDAAAWILADAARRR